jgi:DNA gyrase/topoisomerase IV subunit B
VFDARTGQINMTETRALIYTRNLVIEFVNQMVTRTGGYHSDIHNALMRTMEESIGNPQLEDE